MNNRVGIFSGTFDPIHLGHIAFAVETLKVCRLDKIVFLPEEKPREKHGVTDISHRLELLKLATKDMKKFDVVTSDSKQFSVKDTLPELQNMFKGASFTLLIGSDVVKTFSYRWDNLGTLLNNVSLAIGMRNSDTVDEIMTIIKQLETNFATNIDYKLINAPNMDIASSGVRNNQLEKSRLNSAVDVYIKKHKLYNC